MRSRDTPRPALIAALATGAIALAGALPGQVTNMDVNSDFPYTFLPPGARSVGMGGAFTALADDATAAWSNPAGLLHLSRPEISIELRHQRVETPLADGPGVYGVGPDGRLGQLPPYTDYESDSTGLSFLSYTHPRPAWSVGVFRGELLRFSVDAETDLVAGPRQFDDIAPRDVRADLSIAVWGVAGAWRATPRLWLGGALTLQKLDFSARQTDRRTRRRLGGQRVEAHDDGPAVNLGLLWKPVEQWRFGLAWRGGARLDADYAQICGTTPTGARPFVCQQQGIRDGEPVPSLSGTTTFKVPDALTAGAAWALTDRLTASLQWDRIAYSQLTEGLRNSLTVTSDLERYVIDDADDLHFGLEWLTPVGSDRVLAWRAGAWLEQEHSLRYEGEVLSGSGREQLAAALFATPIGDQWHGTAGFGFTFGRRFQVDAAADLSRYRQTYQISSVTRF